MANGRCHIHGGKSLKGMDSPQFKDGRYSKYMPKELLSIYNETSQDTQLLSLRAEIALTDAILSSLLPKLETGESGQGWVEISKLIGQAIQAHNSAKPPEVIAYLRTIDEIVGKRLLYYATESEIRNTLETRRKLVETETKISMQNERAISVEQLMLLMTQILGVIQSVVTEEKQRYAIAVELQRLVSLPSGDASTN